MGQVDRKYPVIRLEETESTNLYLKQLVRTQHPEEGAVVMADFQLKGRGQMGNSWFASKGENLLFSLVVYPQYLLAGEQFIISRITSLAVKNTLGRFTAGICIKWPNDIYCGELKIAGILIENDIQGKYIGNTVIGIGLNINEEIFPDGLPNPVSLRQVTGTRHDREQIFSLFYDEFFSLYDLFRNGGRTDIEAVYMRDLYRRDGYHAYEDKGGRFMAKVKEVMPSGHLVLTPMDGGEERIYAFKEVAFVR